MPIKFLNVPGSTNLRSSRPAGYKFPTGLSAISTANTVVDYLVIAGGGGGASLRGGGGGAGGYLTASGTSLPAGTPYAVTVGGGGPGVSNFTGTSGNP